MKKFWTVKGSNIYDFFIVPTIRINKGSGFNYLAIEWLKWYFGIAWG